MPYRSPEAAQAPASYAVRRHAAGGGRKDILALGKPDGALPYLQVEIYRAGSEIVGFDDPMEIIANARALELIHHINAGGTIASKFGPLTLVSFIAAKGTPAQLSRLYAQLQRSARAVVRLVCQGGMEFIEQITLACALDRLPPCGGQRAQAGRLVRPG